jgi:hypothetical protein
MAATSFANDVMPILNQFKGQMMWRFDLTSYDQMKANAALIYNRIQTKQMPPPPFPPLSDEQIRTFKSWMDGGCQP